MRKRPWTQEDDDDLRRLYAQGWSDKTLGLMLVRSPEIVGRRRRKLGIGPSHGLSSQGRKERAVSEATRKRNSEAMKRRWADPDYREKMTRKVVENGQLDRARIASVAVTKGKLGCRGYKHSAKQRAAQSKRQREWYKNDPAYRERILRMSKIGTITPRKFKVPTEKRKLYLKMKDALGKEKARQLVKEGAL